MRQRLLRRAHRALVRPLAEVRRRSPAGERVTGHHNVNVIAPLGQVLAFLLGMPSGATRANFRTPLVAVEVAPRIWPRESEVLRVVGEHVDDVPACLVDYGDWALHQYLPGHALSEVSPGGPVGEARIEALAQFFVWLADIPPAALPPLPADWPADGDTHGFLRWLARFTEERVHLPNRPRFGTLFDAVGIPADAMARFLRTVPELSRRPFALLHTDVHRANVVVARTRGGERLSVIDWELALYGDPLHDLATHVVRMGYDTVERKLAVESWVNAMERGGHPDMMAGLDRDLPVYLGFEYAQSVFPDIMRAAQALPAAPDGNDLSRAAGRIRGALLRAREPLRLPDVPGEDAVVEALWQWHGDHRGRTEERMERHGC